MEEEKKYPEPKSVEKLRKEYPHQFGTEGSWCVDPNKKDTNKSGEESPQSEITPGAYDC